MEREEIRKLNRLREISMHLGLTALAVSRRESSVDPKEIRKLKSEIKSHIEAVDRLMSAPDINRHETSNDPISEEERQIGGIVHGVINENLPIEEAEARLKLTAELNASDHPTEDK